MLIEPQKTVITDGNGKEHEFYISKMTALDGLEIMTRLPASVISGSIPKLGDWEIVRELQAKIMQFVAVDVNGNLMPLTTKELINNHTGDWECLLKLMKAEVVYNNSFFRDGTISDFFVEAWQAALAKISEILTLYSEQLSPTIKQPSTNSAPSTP